MEKDPINPAIAEIKAAYKETKEELNKKSSELKVQYKEEYLSKLQESKEAFADKLAGLQQNLVGAITPEEKQTAKFEIKNEKYYQQQRISEIKGEYRDRLQALKDEKYNAYMKYYHDLKRENNDKVGIDIALQRKAIDYTYQFNLKNFLLTNGLYFIILLFIIVSVIVAPIIDKGNLLTIDNILEILEQSSTRIFFALGVGGLILLSGTDLSIGRQVGMGAVVTCMFLHPGKNIIKLFDQTVDFSAIPMWLNAIFALLISIALCVAFSALAGFFTARLNMHPFVTTLATQLIIFGLVCFATGTTSSGSIDGGIKSALAGRWGNFPIILIYAIVCVAVIWFIWNKTKFGKNMYAVGGNKEAAAVSGINVFKTTMLVFVMAGVLYGMGSWLEGLRIGTAVATTGTGYELDAIAACVVGGISFSGGVGKIKGAVIGVLLFTSITYILTFLGLDTNIQFIIKGIIIMAAVALDSVKYLKRK